MPREQVRKVISSIINLVSEIPIGTNEFIPVGDGRDPVHEFPYLVVRQIAATGMTGPLSDTDADSTLRVQFTGVGETREQADFVRDKVRVLMTKRNLNNQFADDSIPRSVLRLTLDLGRMDRWDRGTAESRYGAIDQYMIETTPA